ncbi:MAG: hypothetical protein JW941_07385, partial [Candidatus Coatesbacteria bacterium]|nr:hypothetical protein [Candidatus Coatesbacteria bacterium]
MAPTHRICMIVCIMVLVFSGSIALGIEAINLDVKCSEYRITSGRLGGEVIQMDGFSTNGLPGSPMLPRKVFDVALPPDVNWDSVVVRAQDIEQIVLPGTHDIESAPP